MSDANYHMHLFTYNKAEVTDGDVNGKAVQAGVPTVLMY